MGKLSEELLRRERAPQGTRTAQPLEAVKGWREGESEPGAGRADTTTHDPQASQGDSRTEHGEARRGRTLTALQAGQGPTRGAWEPCTRDQLRKVCADFARSTPEGKAWNGGRIPRNKTLLMKLCRWVQGRGEWRGGAAEAWRWLSATAEDWLLYLGVLGTVSGGEAFEDEEDAQLAWEDTWGRVRFPEGEESVEAALRHAREEPLHLSAVWPDAGERAVLVATALARLQVVRGGLPVHAPRRHWGAALGCAPDTVFRVIRAMLRRDLLREVDGGKYSRIRGKAVEYRVNLSALPEATLSLESEERVRLHELYEALPRWQSERAASSGCRTVRTATAESDASKTTWDSEAAPPPESHEGNGGGAGSS